MTWEGGVPLRDIAILAFIRHFPGVTLPDLARSVVLPEDDPGRNSPKSLLIVYTFHGLRDPWIYGGHEKWEAVENELSKHVGRPVYFESVNPEVQALYYA